MNQKLWKEFLNRKVAIDYNPIEVGEILKLCAKEKLTWPSGVPINPDDVSTQHVYYFIRFISPKLVLDYTSNREFLVEKGYKFAKYQEFNITDKKTFTGPELAQLLKDKKIKKGAILEDENCFTYTVGTYCDIFELYGEDKRWITSNDLIYRTFTLIEEPKLIFLNQAAKEGKKIKLKDWRDYQPIEKIINYLNQQNKETIQNALTKPIWEVEE